MTGEFEGLGARKIFKHTAQPYPSGIFALQYWTGGILFPLPHWRWFEPLKHKDVKKRKNSCTPFDWSKKTCLKDSL